MKKKFCLLLLIITMIVLGVSCKKEEPDPMNIAGITQMTLTPPEFVTDITGFTSTTPATESAQEFGKLIGEVLKLTPMEAGSYSPRNEISIEIAYNDQTTRKYSLDFDLTALTAVLNSDSGSYSISGELYTTIAKNENIVPYLMDSFTPPILVELNALPQVTTLIRSNFVYPWYNGPKTINNETGLIVTVDSPNPWSTSLDHFLFEFDRKPDRIIENIYDANMDLVASNTLESYSLINPPTEGKFVVEIVAEWGENEAIYQFPMHYDLPVEFALVNETAMPGDLFVVTAKNVNEGQTVELTNTLIDKEVEFFPYDDLYVGMIPSNSFSSAGMYEFTVSTTEANETITSFTSPIELLSKDYPVQHMTISENAVSLRTPENEASDQVHFDRSRENPVQEKLWEGPFIQPAEGVITTEFGQIRYTNDNPTPSIHNGIDFANPIGTPVYAANTGKVVVAVELIIFGNTIIIDHGMGIYSYYYHLDELLVEEGIMVTKGDLIAKMGTTGYSTGSHLHFSISKYDVRLNPWTFMDLDYLEFSKKE